MCGIVGYIGKRQAEEVLIEGLQKLAYRGYDSAGVAIYNGEVLQVSKAVGHLAALRAALSNDPLSGQVGIGHTRWATHGKPSDRNAHPHTDSTQKFSIVHNGIIENYMTLKEDLIQKGHQFQSETDSEVIAHLIAESYTGNIVEAVRLATIQLKGAYALAVMTEYEPEKLIAVRSASPLIVGIGEGENFLGSDIPALLAYTRNMIILEDGDMAILTKDNVQLLSYDSINISREMIRVEWELEAAEKNGFDHFMLKEIYDQPKAYRDTMNSRLSGDKKTIVLNELSVTDQTLRTFRHIHIVACGTAYHAGLVGKTVIEQLTRIPVEIDLASEYRYRNPIIDKQTLVIVVSQSGETADTLAALREAKRCGAHVIAITNVVGSSVAREADDVLPTWAGPEIAVASTKAYTSQLIAFYLLGGFIAQTLKMMSGQQVVEWIAALSALPQQVEHLLQQVETIRELSTAFAEHDHLFFIGRSLDYAVAQEGSLKLKEISYIHSEAYAAGELKHGTLALVEEGTPVIALATQPDIVAKTISNIKEVTTRGGQVLGIGTEGDLELAQAVHKTLYIPKTLPLLTPALSIIPLQLLAYYVSLIRGNDVDKPRNLAKSVTVE